MDSSLNQMFMKVIAVNLIVVGLFAVAVSLIAVVQKKYDDKSQRNKLYIYFVGGILLIVIGAIIY
jgi:uncharacterized membrane protein